MADVNERKNHNTPEKAEKAKLDVRIDPVVDTALRVKAAKQRLGIAEAATEAISTWAADELAQLRAERSSAA